MPGPARAGALVYAKNLNRMARFYEAVLGMRVLKADETHEVMEHADAQLIVHAIPPHIAETFEIETPPLPRDEQAIKLFYTVASLETARAVAKEHGGALFGPVLEIENFSVQNGFDPEGNIFHLREVRP
jgi:predicted enzyme related to lactoylglutathione lyase